MKSFLTAMTLAFLIVLPAPAQSGGPGDGGGHGVVGLDCDAGSGCSICCTGGCIAILGPNGCNKKCSGSGSDEHPCGGGGTVVPSVATVITRLCDEITLTAHGVTLGELLDTLTEATGGTVSFSHRTAGVRAIPLSGFSVAGLAIPDIMDEIEELLQVEVTMTVH